MILFAFSHIPVYSFVVGHYNIEAVDAEGTDQVLLQSLFLKSNLVGGSNCERLPRNRAILWTIFCVNQPGHRCFIISWKDESLDDRSRDHWNTLPILGPVTNHFKSAGPIQAFYLGVAGVVGGFISPL